MSPFLLLYSMCNPPPLTPPRDPKCFFIPVRSRAAYKFKVNCRAVSYAVQTSRSNSKVRQVVVYDAISMFNPDNEQKVRQKGKFIRGMKAQP